MFDIAAVFCPVAAVTTVCGTCWHGPFFQGIRAAVFDLAVFCVAHSSAGALCTWLPTKVTLRLCTSCLKLAVTWTSRTMWVDPPLPSPTFHPTPAARAPEPGVTPWVNALHIRSLFLNLHNTVWFLVPQWHPVVLNGTLWTVPSWAYPQDAGASPPQSSAT